MKKHHPNPDETISLLIGLLNAEQTKRETIATHFHEKKSELAVVGLYLNIMEKDAKEGKFKPDSIQLPRKILNDSLEDLRSISYDIYPKIVSLSGLLTGLKQLAKDSETKFSTSLRLHLNTTAPLPLDKTKEVRIYWICEAIVEYLSLVNPLEINLTLSSVNDQLHLEISTEKPGRSGPPLKESTQKLQLIRARLIWQSAQVLTGTNWNNRFSLAFALT